jgi:hypothetical protein
MAIFNTVYKSFEEPRVPWANTVAYYPLNSTDTTRDKSGNGYNLSNRGATTFWEIGGVSCGIFSNSNTSWLYNDSIQHPTWTNPFTISMRCYPTSYNSTEDDCVFIGTAAFSGKWFAVYRANPLSISARWASSSATSWLPLNMWSLLTITQNWWQYNAYINWTNVILNASQTTNITWTRINIWYCYWNGGVGYWFIWWISNVIVEDKVRTAQEIADYYNQTKANYWIL